MNNKKPPICLRASGFGWHGTPTLHWEGHHAHRPDRYVRDVLIRVYHLPPGLRAGRSSRMVDYIFACLHPRLFFVFFSLTARRLVGGLLTESVRSGASEQAEGKRRVRVRVRGQPIYGRRRRAQAGPREQSIGSVWHGFSVAGFTDQSWIYHFGDGGS